MKYLPTTPPPKNSKTHRSKASFFQAVRQAFTNPVPPALDPDIATLGLPILGICYGMNLLVQRYSGVIAKGVSGEYGEAELTLVEESLLLSQVPIRSKIWMSHQDTVQKLPAEFKVLGTTATNPYAAIQYKNVYGVHFHPEVHESQYGIQILKNFAYRICGCQGTWTIGPDWLNEHIKKIQKQVGPEKVLCGISGGVDSLVSAVLFQKAIGNRLTSIFVDHGLLRYGEHFEIPKLLREKYKLNVELMDARQEFLEALKGLEDPEEKRKAIGRTFIQVFERRAKQSQIPYLGQGTLCSDIIESQQSNEASRLIKSHHNVGGLPKNMTLKIIEPLRQLFKHEVRKLGQQLGLAEDILFRQPFPGPGLAIRILGQVSQDRIHKLQLADKIAMDELKKAGLEQKIWQSFVVLLPIKTVGVMGDQRTYGEVVSLRAVSGQDGMTADWYRIPFEILSRISTRITNEVLGITRVVYDITSKPPSTIEWE